MNFVETRLFSRMLAASPFSQRELALTITTAPDRYKDHFIKKRNGRGLRLISQPTAEVKYLQRMIVADEFRSLAIHDAAVGYRCGKSIKDHALPHAGNRYLLKLDFADFFPSLKVEALLHCLRLDASYSDLELWIIGQILCRRDRPSGYLQLSIGAPSSPFVSNYLLKEFDVRTSARCAELGVRYTRYADDMAFSTSRPYVLDEVQQYVTYLIAQLGYLNLALNEAKTVNVSKKNQRTLVGLRLANDGAVSVGREEKRVLRAKMHNFSRGLLTAPEVSNLRGQLAFLYGIDPQFVSTICARYGFQKVGDITHVRLVA